MACERCKERRARMQEAFFRGQMYLAAKEAAEGLGEILSGQNDKLLSDWGLGDGGDRRTPSGDLEGQPRVAEQGHDPDAPKGRKSPRKGG